MLGCVRTTLTLDDDVAIELERIRREQGLPLRSVVNKALRAGLTRLATAATDADAVEAATVSVSHGRFVLDIDDASQALGLAEGEDFR